MAEATLLGVAESVVGQLSSPTVKNFFHQVCSFTGVWSFEKDLKRLAQTIETIKCVLYDAERRQSEDRAVKLWLSRLRAVLYEADDLFDAIAARAMRKEAGTFKKKVTLFFSKSNHLCFFTRTVHAIKDIKERLDDIKADISFFQFTYGRIEEKRRVLEREETHSFVDTEVTSVIGRDLEKEEIISMLLSEGDRLSNFEVISVIGSAGLGKTIVAQLVFNDERVQKGFDICLWACINYFSDLESVLVKILTFALHYTPKGLHLDQLQAELRGKIQEKKYLLVLDDVWDANTSNWDKLKTLLIYGKMGSKVLITTRKVKVAKSLNALEPFYRLGALSEDSAFSLFVKVAFNDGEFFDSFELVSLGRQIVDKCGRVPLLVMIIAKVLRFRKKDKEVWYSFLEMEFPKIVSSDDDDVNLRQVLKVSYYDLPLALKRCFAYCAIFPKDYYIDKDELIYMWMAQGFIEPHDGKTVEEVGNHYFSQLVDECFFYEVTKDESDFGVVKYTCKMHNCLHDLAIEVARLLSADFEDEGCTDMFAKGGVFFM